MNKAEQIYNEAFETYIAPSRIDKLIKNGWMFTPFPFGSSKQRKIEMIAELIKEGKNVRSCYCGSSIRGAKEFYIYHK